MKLLWEQNCHRPNRHSFYYAWNCRPIKEEDLAEIEKEMRRIIQVITILLGKELQKEALKFFADQSYKIELH